MVMSFSPWEMITFTGSGSFFPSFAICSIVARIEFFMISKIM